VQRERVTEKILLKGKMMKKIALLLSIMALSAECCAQLLEPLCIESLVAGPLNTVPGSISSLTVNLTGGTAPFTVVFSTPGVRSTTITSAVSPVILTPAAAATYTVAVRDASTPQQTASGQATLGGAFVGGQILALSVAETDATCTESNGSVTATAVSSNGADTFSFLLTSTTPGFSSQTNVTGIFSDLPVGTYTVVATGSASGFRGTGEITVCNNGITHTGNSIMDFIITKKCNGCIAP
jgi:large repetitive protein